MATKNKSGLTGTIRLPSKPKHTRQGEGQNSLGHRGKRRHKLSRGQGKG